MLDDMARLVFLTPADMAGIIAAITTAALVLGGLAAWILSNERRITTLENAAVERKEDIAEIKQSHIALHERLDGYFLGRGHRAPKE